MVLVLLSWPDIASFVVLVLISCTFDHVNSAAMFPTCNSVCLFVNEVFENFSILII